MMNLIKRLVVPLNFFSQLMAFLLNGKAIYPPDIPSLICKVELVR
jgi:hypothetical protein